jgi:protoporphyrinogen oxidase
MMARTPVVVAGAGITGLAAARELQALGQAPELLEAAATVGGLTRSMQVGGFTFDYTGHLLHLSHFASPAEIPYAGLEDSAWQRISRRSSCWLGGARVPAPVQYHMGALPSPLREACIASYEGRPSGPASTGTFRDWMVSGFGQALSEAFLIPQNEKSLAIPMDRLSAAAVRRFFPPPDDAAVRRGFSPTDLMPEEYNSRFWYPRRGGIGALVDGLARGLDRISLMEGVAALDLDRRELRTTRGRTIAWDAMLSSLPLNALCAMSGDAELIAAAASLSHSATVNINLGIRGPLGPSFGDAHWIYTPQPELPFYRVGAYSNISDGTCPPGCASVYVEVGVPGNRIDRLDIAGDLEPRVLDALEQVGWLRRESIVARVTTVIRCAYVHHTPERDARVAFIEERLAAHGIRSIGRYGSWDYTSMEDSILDGIATARQAIA